MQLAAIAVFFGFVHYYFYRVAPPIARSGDSNDIYFVIVLYIFMLLGIVSHFLYSRFEEPKRDRLTFDFGLFIAPIFASPIIFIPLVSALQNANIDLAHLTTPKLMIFLVAFHLVTRLLPGNGLHSGLVDRIFRAKLRLAQNTPPAEAEPH